MKSHLKNKKIWLLLFAITAGVFAAFGTQRYIADHVELLEAQARVPMRTVVVAAVDLPEGSPLNANTLATRDIPVEWISSSSIFPDNFERIESTTLAFALKQGEPVLWSHIEGAKNLLFSSRLAPGRRAITVAVDEINSVAGLVQPGDLIDIYVSFDYLKRRVTAPLLERVKVLATGQQADVSFNEQMAGQRSYSTVTLDTTPDEAIRLLVGRQNGSLAAILRPNDDSQVSDIKQVPTLASLLGISFIPPKPKPKVPVIYGDARIRNMPKIIRPQSADANPQETELDETETDAEPDLGATP